MITETKMDRCEKPSSNDINANSVLTPNFDYGTPAPTSGNQLSAGKLSSVCGRRLSSNGRLPIDYSKLSANSIPPRFNGKRSSAKLEVPLEASKLHSVYSKLPFDSGIPPFTRSKLSSENKLSNSCKVSSEIKKSSNTETTCFPTIKLPSDKTISNTEKNLYSNGKLPPDSKKPPPDSGKPSSEECIFNLERILSEVGSFGKYQLMLLALLAFRDSFLQMCNFNYVFTAAEVNFRCVVPECESGDDLYFNASFVQYALPNLTNTCYRLSSHHEVGSNASLDDGQWNWNDTCRPDAFVGGELVRCDRRVYEDYNSLYAEFDLGCEPWKRTLLGTVHNLGLLFSFLLSGLISDRYGRKVIIVGTPLVVGVAGLLKSFAQSYWLVVLLEFLETALGYGNASMVLSLELVSQQHRVVFSCLCDAAACVGGALLGAVAWRVRYWRLLLRAIYAPLLAAIAYCFLMDEGVRWLVAHGRRAEAARVLHKVVRYNNVTLSRRASDMLHSLAHRSVPQRPDSSRSSLLAALCSRRIVLRVLLLAACFLCCLFVYSGSIIYSTSLTGDKFLNFSTMWMVAVPARALTALALTRWGRRVPLCVAYSLCGACFIAAAFVPVGWRWVTVSLYAVGATCSSFGVFAMTVFALELLPTRARNSLLNVASTAGRLGTVLAPQAPLLARVWSGLPALTFGVSALCAGALCVLLPDTSRADLPDHVPDAEQLQPDTDTTTPASVTTTGVTTAGVTTAGVTTTGFAGKHGETAPA